MLNPFRDFLKSQEIIERKFLCDLFLWKPSKKLPIVAGQNHFLLHEVNDSKDTFTALQMNIMSNSQGYTVELPDL